MADNVTTQSATLATIPASTKISTDEDGTNGHVQRVKLAVSADGSSTHITANSTGMQMQGPAAEDAAVAGNPVLVAGRYDATARGLDTGDAGTIAVDITGAVHIKTYSKVLDLTLTTSSVQYASGDVLAEVQKLNNAVRVSGGSGVIQSLVVVDKDDQAQAMDIIIASTSITLGTENTGVTITDADAASIFGIVEVTGADYVDLVNSQSAQIRNIGMVVNPSGTSSIWVGAISRGTGTYTSTGVVLRIGILQD